MKLRKATSQSFALVHRRSLAGRVLWIACGCWLATATRCEQASAPVAVVPAPGGQPPAPRPPAGGPPAAPDAGSPTPAPADAAAGVAVDGAATATPPAPPAPPAPPRFANERSPLGTNLTGITDYSAEWTFVDAFRASRDWISGNAKDFEDGKTVEVDAHGWVKSLRSGQIARTVLLWDVPDFPEGAYVVLYEGHGTIEYGMGAHKNASASRPGRDVLDVNPKNGGILLNITATDPANYLRNIRVIMPGGVCSNDAFRWCDGAHACDQGGSCQSFEENYATQVFHPTFLDSIKRYRTLRFADWFNTNGSRVSSWASRPSLQDARWSTAGVPLEIALLLANRLHAEPWLNLPHLADDDYFTRAAQLVKETLDPTLSVYIEYSNEVWNLGFEQGRYAQQQAVKLGLGGVNEYEQAIRFNSVRAVQMFRIFRNVFENSPRVIRVLGGQAGSSFASTTVLDFRNAKADADALAIAPFFGYELGDPEDQGPRAQKMTVDDLMGELRDKTMPAVLMDIREQAQIAASRGLHLVSSEGGQHLVGIGPLVDSPEINRLFDLANRDPRMGDLYLAYLEGWKASGGELMVHFVNCSTYSKWGRWGAIESLRQPRAQAPKFDALMTFIDHHDPWWLATD